ncbi:sigma-54 dependent transcriptional regulator [Hahella sp. SMD15-11]|uniref:Sigma-54 dependent transcriptional regulator n=1 Tax=Thermohahella caldifontis TaxID=3142973 RepID=A0AB39UV42_9GAMM
MTSHILVVEDEGIIRSAVKRLLEHNGYRVSDTESVEQALELAERDRPDLIITDMRLPGRPGTDLIGALDGVPVLIMTSYASLRSAVDSMKKGAVDYIAKPFDHEELLASVREILERHTPAAPEPHVPARTTPSSAQPMPEATTDEQGLFAGILYGRCKAMQRLFRLIERIAPTQSTVLIQGESGTGKELAAKALHSLSPRRDKPMMSVNCAAIPETLIESELFGHIKGAFTGAVSDRTGLVEAADGGTLFLDEIGELPLEAQARLLRVLQEGEIRPVGSTQSKKVDVRLIAATHRNLKAMCQTGEFREDLYYRLNVMQLQMPALREREEDILGLANMLLARTAANMGRSGLYFSDSAKAAISRYRWPGNVREMENAIERAVILAEGDAIDAQALGIEVDEDTAIPSSLVNTDNPSGTTHSRPQDLSLEDYFQHFVLENQDTMSETELAKRLGISRKSLWERRQRLGIPRPKKKKTS